MSNKHIAKKRLAAFILTPPAFLLVGYLALYIAFGSMIYPVAGIMGLLMSGNAQYESEDLMINRLDGYTDTVPSSLINFPNYGDVYGKLTIESAGIDAPLYYGDGKAQLKKGACQYNGTMYIGSGSTVLISAHNNTYFHTLGNAAVGDTVKISTNYGDYVYTVERIAITGANAPDSYDLAADYENLVLYTCYPFNTLGLTNERYFVYCKYISGPKILYDE